MKRPMARGNFTALQQSLGALTDARDSLNAACKIACASIDTVERAMAAERLRDGEALERRWDLTPDSA
jgi:hypothetical protein